MTLAAVVTGPDSPVEVVEIDLGPVGPRDVKVRVRAAGVCHSDLSLATGVLRQQFPVVLGHEAAGQVVEVGSEVTRARPGDRVVLVWSPPCGECHFCGLGEPWLCERADATAALSRATLSRSGEPAYPALAVGAFAEETVVPEIGVTPLPEGVPFDVGALLGCAVATGVGAVRNVAQVRPGESVAVVGCGGVGLAAVLGARAAGAGTIVAVDPSEQRRALARTLGATHAVPPDDQAGTAVRAATGGYGVDHAIEAAGRSESIRLAYKLARRGGNVVVVGIGGKDDMVQFSALELFHWGRSIHGCVFGATDLGRDLPRLGADFRAGRLPLELLVTDRCGLDGVGAAFDRMRAGAGARTLVVP